LDGATKEAAVDEKGLERRICQRFSIEGAAISYQKQKLLRFMMKDEERNCPVVDLSRGGMCFLNQKPLKLHSKVSVQLFTPDESIPLSLEGRVRWSVPTPGKSYRYQAGVQFNAYGLEWNQNAPHLLDSLVALETKFVERRRRSTSPGTNRKVLVGRVPAESIGVLR
jgi:Tfp pilus assembly protein PilZ